jgi:putative tricarboxylic transport membrane protein
MSELALSGIVSTLKFFPLAMLTLGTFSGIVFGAIPGMTASMGIVLFLPFTFKMDPISSIALLIGIFTGGISGGLVSATLLRMPGTPSSVTTCFDAYPMAQKGEPGKALGIGILSSFVGGITTAVALVFIAPPVANLAIKMGNFEYFSLGVFALSIVIALSKGSMVKGLISGWLGLLFAMIGSAPVDMAQRFTFGMNSMAGGFNLLSVLIGIFAISQIISDVASESDFLVPKVDTKNVFPGFSVFVGDGINLVRSTLIGFFIGILPGIGGATANVVAYAEAKARSKTPELFGTGTKSGIIASESSNNATIAGALIPMLTMGIPGDAVTAVLIGGLMIQGLQPGPLLFKANADFVYSVFTSVFLANWIMLAMMIFGIRIFIKTLSIRKTYLLPLIALMCVVGSFALNNRMFDVWSLFFFGVVGYVLEKSNFPLTPIILGFVMESLIETNLRQGLMSSSGSFLPLVSRPVSLLFLLLAAGSIVLPLLRQLYGRREAFQK